jgi:hypothetical protein
MPAEPCALPESPSIFAPLSEHSSWSGVARFIGAIISVARYMLIVSTHDWRKASVIAASAAPPAVGAVGVLPPAPAVVVGGGVVAIGGGAAWPPAAAVGSVGTPVPGIIGAERPPTITLGGGGGGGGGGVGCVTAMTASHSHGA